MTEMIAQAQPGSLEFGIAGRGAFVLIPGGPTEPDTAAVWELLRVGDLDRARRLLAGDLIFIVNLDSEIVIEARGRLYARVQSALGEIQIAEGASRIAPPLTIKVAAVGGVGNDPEGWEEIEQASVALVDGLANGSGITFTAGQRLSARRPAAQIPEVSAQAELPPPPPEPAAPAVQEAPSPQSPSAIRASAIPPSAISGAAVAFASAQEPPAMAAEAKAESAGSAVKPPVGKPEPGGETGAFAARMMEEQDQAPADEWDDGVAQRVKWRFPRAALLTKGGLGGVAGPGGAPALGASAAAAASAGAGTSAGPEDPALAMSAGADPGALASSPASSAPAAGLGLPSTAPAEAATEKPATPVKGKKRKAGKLAGKKKATPPPVPPGEVEILLPTGELLNVERDIYLGREPLPTLSLDEPRPQLVVLGESEVSRLHCRIALIDGVVTVTDLGATNGTRLIDPIGAVEALVPQKPHPFLSGSQVDIGEGLLITRTR